MCCICLHVACIDSRLCSHLKPKKNDRRLYVRRLYVLCACVYVLVYMRACACVCMRTCVYVHVCACVCVYMLVCACVHAYIFTCTCSYVMTYMTCTKSEIHLLRAKPYGLVMCTYTCVCLCMNVYTVLPRKHLDTYTHKAAAFYVCMYFYVYDYVCICVRMYVLPLCVSIFTHVILHACIYVPRGAHYEVPCMIYACAQTHTK